MAIWEIISNWSVKGHNGRYVFFDTYDKVSDQGPVWVRKDVIFQVQEKNIFILQNHSQMVLLGVWREDFTKKSPDHLFQVIRWSGAVLT